MGKIYALVDCNSFFCSCERLFRPELRHRPVGVLSNNDGCFVSRTNELKKLGVKMGDPYFKVKDICEKNKVAVFSSNFSLYTNISDRVMTTLSEFTPVMEVYSVDEAFLDLSGFQNLNEYAQEIKKTVERKTGIPVSIGIAPTKTLAKIANHIAKKSDKAKGVVVLMDTHLQDEALRRVEVGDVWGVGRATSAKLQQLGIKTAKDFKDYKNKKQIQKLLTKVGLQMKEELEGHARFELEVLPTKKKEIISSRSFGQSVKDLTELRQAVSRYVTTACEKLRKQGSVCASVDVYACTSPFSNKPYYSALESSSMLTPTSDTRKVIRYALGALEELYRAGYDYKKAGIRLHNIYDRDEAQMSLFEKADDLKSEALMNCMDQINQRDGAGTIIIAEANFGLKKWSMNRNFHSPRYVTGWSELPKVY